MFISLIRRFLKIKDLASGKTEIHLSLVLLVIFGLAAWGIVYFEKDSNDAFQTLWDGFYWSVVTASTLGYGDKFAKTFAGQGITIFLIFTAVGTFSCLIGAVSSSLIEHRKKKRKGFMKMKEGGHIVICGWDDSDGPSLVEELLITVRKVVIVADLLETPLHDSCVHFIRGYAAKKEVLEKANICGAKAAVVLAKDGRNIESDSISAMICHAIRNMAPEMPISVSIVEPESREYFPSGCACLDFTRIGINMLVQSVTDWGTEEIVCRLTNSHRGNNFFRIDMPDSLAGKTFGDALKWSAEKEMIVVGLESDGERLINPPRGSILKKRDALFVISRKRPS